ncbi:MAG: NAD synthetase [Caulobacteraceae bacterium]|nr:NAD synthetase [Caulobacteraceae bacterium]
MSIGCNYDNPWIYEEKIFENTLNHRSYIGRKYFWQFRTPKGKNRKVKSESDWKKYYGSCPELKEDIQKFGKENFTRNILSLHRTKGKTNFEETRQLFVHNVLTESLDDGTPAWYNSNILSRYFRKDYYGNTD